MNEKNLLGFASTLILTGCAAQPPAIEDTGLSVCPDPRPQICTMDYNPVCARFKSDAPDATYSNACGACSDPRVQAHSPGSCEP